MYFVFNLIKNVNDKYILPNCNGRHPRIAASALVEWYYNRTNNTKVTHATLYISGTKLFYFSELIT